MAAKSKIKAERVDASIYRILDGEKVVALAMRLTNKKWALHDPNDKRLTATTFDAPKDAAAHYEANFSNV